MRRVPLRLPKEIPRRPQASSNPIGSEAGVVNRACGVIREDGQLLMTSQRASAWASGLHALPNDADTLHSPARLLNAMSASVRHNKTQQDRCRPRRITDTKRHKFSDRGRPNYRKKMQEKANLTETPSLAQGVRQSLASHIRCPSLPHVAARSHSSAPCSCHDWPQLLTTGKDASPSSVDDSSFTMSRVASGEWGALT